ncbi:MAG: prepilin peptidase [Bacilli bacterium]
MVYVIVLLFIIGTIFGSFFTVVGMRMPMNESIVKPRSHCTNCNHQLSFFELIPIISWVIQKGKCRKCGTAISIAYPLVEILTGFLFAIAFYEYGFSYEFFAMIIISSILVTIFISDFIYFVILDEVLIIGSILILILKYIYFGPKVLLYSIISGFVLFLFMYGIKFFGDRAYKTESLGGGDIKLAMFFGFTLGIRLSFISLVLGSLLALPYALYYVITKKNRQIPFGPFLISGMLIIFILQTKIVNFIDMIL